MFFLCDNVKLKKLGIFSNLLLTALKFVFLHNWTLLLSNKDLLWSHCLQLSPSPFLLQRNVVYFSSSASCQAMRQCCRRADQAACDCIHVLPVS